MDHNTFGVINALRELLPLNRRAFKEVSLNEKTDFAPGATVMYDSS